MAAQAEAIDQLSYRLALAHSKQNLRALKSDGLASRTAR